MPKKVILYYLNFLFKYIHVATHTFYMRKMIIIHESRSYYLSTTKKRRV